MHMKRGLTSVTFRNLIPETIVALVAEADLDGIEWAGDVHLPPGNTTRAKQISALTRNAGLALPSYGSYYRAGDSAAPKDSFLQIRDTAVELGVKAIRVWAGALSSDVSSEEYRRMVIDDLCRIGLLAREAGITIGCEYHCKTLTDTTESALDLAEKTAQSNVKLYWQPPNGASYDYCLAGLKAILPYFCHAHVFSWKCTETEIIRLPLAEKAEEWKKYLALISLAAPESWAFLEFVKGDGPQQFQADAVTLKTWI